MSPLWWFYFLAAVLALALGIAGAMGKVPWWASVIVLSIIHIISSLMMLK
jgi:hypothetical protein